MKSKRQSKILEIINQYQVETQEELSSYLEMEGFTATQATISRDIRELKLTKIAGENGKQRYAVISDTTTGLTGKYVRVLQEGFLSMDRAENIVVIKTVAGMASAVGAAVDAMKINELLGSLAGDDTILCVIRTAEDAKNVMERLQKMIEES